MEQRYNPKELHLLFKRLFETEDGKQVLAVLEQRFEKPSVIPMQVADGTAMIPLTFTRIGETNVVKYVKTIIEREPKYDRDSDSD